MVFLLSQTLLLLNSFCTIISELGESMHTFTLLGRGPGLLPVAVITIMAKATCGRGGLLAYTSTSPSIVEGNQGRNLERETEAETTGACYPLTCTLWLAQLAFLYISDPYAYMVHHSYWAQENTRPSHINY